MALPLGTHPVRISVAFLLEWITMSENKFSDDREILQDISNDAWEYLANHTGIRKFLKDCYGHLLCNTHNSQKPFDPYGFAGGAIDHLGFSRYDAGTAGYFYDRICNANLMDGAVVRSSVFLLFKYRKQLAEKFNIEFPKQLWTV
jgi:hypothetical protein